LLPALTEVAQVVPTVVVLADDLIWATRLDAAITAAGAQPRAARRLTDLQRLLAPGVEGDAPAGAGFAIIDLTARAYDGIEAIRIATGTGARVVAVGQHDDATLRRAALAAGAERVFTYRALFEDGPRTLGAWLGR
jgi:hypothetical protein